MFCPNCGAEYPQKINYCKRCGSNMAPAANTVEVHLPRPRLTGMFWAIAAMSIGGLIACFTALSEFARAGLRGDDLLIPFMGGLLFIGVIAAGMIWQLARLVSAFQQNVRQPTKAETLLLPQYEMPVSPLAIPQEPLSSVSEHTTRSFDPTILIEAEKRRRRE